MDDDCHVYMRGGYINRVLGKCGGNLSGTFYDDGIQMKVGECSFTITCSGRNNTRCVRIIEYANSPSQTETLDWNQEYHFKFKTQ